MPLALAFIGLCLVIAAARGTHRELGSQFAEDVGGPSGFFWWIVALFILGVIGAAQPLRQFSRGMMGLALLAFILSNRNVFAQGLAALRETRPNVASEALPSASNSSPRASTPGGSVTQAGGSAVSASLSNEQEKGAESAENGKMGATAGSLAGGIIGSFFGPVGTVVGSAIGGMAGGAIGKAV